MPDGPPLPLADIGKKEKDPNFLPLNLENSDKEENDTDFPSSPSTDNGEEENDPYLTPSPLVYSAYKEVTSNYMSVIYHVYTLALFRKVIKFFERLGWFSVEVVHDLVDVENNQMYTIIFTGGKEEN